MPSVRCVLSDAERVIEERLHQRPQEQFLIRAMLQPLDAGEVEVRPVNVRLQHAADLVRMRPRRADDRPGVAIQEVGAQQHQIAKLQRAGQAVIGQQRHRRAHVGLAELLARQCLLQPLRQLGETQQPDVRLVAHRHHGILQLGQQARRARPRQLVPRNAPGDELFQLGRLAAVLLVRTILARLGAGREPVGKAVLLAKPVDLGVAELHPADVDLREDQQPGTPRLRVSGGLQCLEPIAGLDKRIVLLRIDEQQRQRGFLEKELMDQAVILLPGQIPQQRLALQRGIGRQRQIEPPDVHAMRAILDDVAILDQAMRQRGLAHRSLAEQHDLGIHVAARCLSRRRRRTPVRR